MEMNEYFKKIEKEVKEIYNLSSIARSKGLDPADKVEIPLARSLAEKVVGLISTIYPQMADSGIAKRILELEKNFGKLDPAVSLQIAEEIAKQKFCQFASLKESIDAGARVGFAYITLGVVSSPIEGLTNIEFFKTSEGKEYFSPFYSGPIRSAGGTGAAFSLIIIDHLRELFGFEKYIPTEEEIKRTVTEIHDYHERITNLQYMPTDEEITYLARNIPLQINGEPSEKLEVSNYKNLQRIGTNFIRGGVCLVIGEGIAQKSSKIKRYIYSLREKGFKLSDWDFIDTFVEIHKKRDSGKTEDSPTYIKDIVAGRPILGHPSRSGAFRFRYGRGRVSGFSAASLNPATMAVTNDFIAIGTQLKIEKPTKGCVVTPCDKIEGPIVKLFSGSVKKIKSKEEAKKLYNDIDEIIYLGDILFSLGDLINRNHELIKPGYVEEWWGLELREKQQKQEIFELSLPRSIEQQKQEIFEHVNFPNKVNSNCHTAKTGSHTAKTGNFGHFISGKNEKQQEITKTVDPYEVSYEDALRISKQYNIPLHPNFIFYWTEISRDQFFSFVDWLATGKISKKIILPFTKKEQERFKEGKRALELLGIEHNVVIENVIIERKDAKALFSNIGVNSDLLDEEDLAIKNILDSEKIKSSSHEGVLDIINFVSEFEIKDKAGDFIGARMGRPEKAKLRKLIGSPNSLFPVGKEGGRLRSVQAACEKQFVKGAFPLFFCENCKKETIYSLCENCLSRTKKMYYFPDTNEKSFSKKTDNSEKEGVPFYNRQVDIARYFNNALKKLNLKKDEVPVLIKGVRGMSSSGKKVENLCKGILRAIFDLQVNKDGTIRFDATELPLTYFKPKEIFVKPEKLKELGYEKDIFGNELTEDNQMLELMPHDIILPCSQETPDERADDVFIKSCNFIDTLLSKFYGMNPFYNIKKREDLVGQIGVCMAPHNCAGVICRFIGFSNTQGIFASPFMHAAIRRDCDGDEAAIMLLADVLLNFSREFLPSHRGGTQDAPLVLNAKIDAGEVDDQILDFEVIDEYPLELYRMAEKRKHSSEIKIRTIKSVLKENGNPFVNLGFTHDTSNFNEGVVCSSYKLLGTMSEKVKNQMELVEKIRAADTLDTAKLIIERHFIKDMRGNLRKFSMQQFRCVSCNEILRRPPLSGICPKCNGKIIFTINEGGIKKYLDPAMDLAKKYNLSPYIQQSLELTKRYIDSVFGKEQESQESLGKWF